MSKITQEDHDKALEMLRQGMSLRNIAAATGHSRPTIATIAKQHGIQTAKKRTVADCGEIIMQMAEEGKTEQEIADAIGYSRRTVYVYLLEKRKAAKKPVKVEDSMDDDDKDSNLTFAEPKRINISRVECGGKAYMDVTDLYCPG